MKHTYSFNILAALLVISFGADANAQAEVKPVARVVDEASATTAATAKLDLGDAPGTPSTANGQSQVDAQTPGGPSASSTVGTPPPFGTSPSGTRKQASAGTKSALAKGAAKPRLLGALEDSGTNPTNWTERIQFDRAPVKVSLPVSIERLVTFPNPVALHVPAGSEGVLWTQVMERTAYIRALGPLEGLRVVAEDLVTGQMVPLDFFATESQGPSTRELEIFYKSTAAQQSGTGAGKKQPGEDAADGADGDEPSLDMVALTRYAAQYMYSPKRLIPSAPGVYPVPIQPTAISGLIRGQRVSAVPMGQWRSGSLYVTAVRVTNLERITLDLDLDQVRGTWIAATPQHRRLLAAGTDWDSTTLYLVCSGSFETCK